MLPDIEAGRDLVIAVSETGDARLSPAAPGPWRWDETGPTSYDLPCRSVARVQGLDDAPAGVQRLRLDREWPHRIVALGHRYAGRFAAVTLDAHGRLRLCRRHFSSAEQAAKSLASCRGSWLILFIQQGRLHPRLAATDPFTTDFGMEGSYVAAGSGTLRGPFVGEREHFVEWIRTHFPSGYYGVQLLERIEVVVEPDSPPPPARAGVCRVFLRREEGSALVLGDFPDVAAARAAIRSKPGRWLLARSVETVSLH